MSKYDIFLSHSEQDEELIEKIDKSLTSINFDVYVEEYERNFGTDVVESVCEAIDSSNYFMVILTDKSIISQWVNQEIGYAYANEKNIIPVYVGKIKLRGMITTIKGIKVKEYNINDVVSKIVWHFIKEDDISKFKFECEKCGEEWWIDIPEKKDLYNWRKKNQPIKDKCGECNHYNKFNPETLLFLD
jgi:hypothetical protein